MVPEAVISTVILLVNIVSEVDDSSLLVTVVEPPVLIPVVVVSIADMVSELVTSELLVPVSVVSNALLRVVVDRPVSVVVA